MQGDYLVEQTKEFIKRAFQENPHYSFNDWSVMYDHSVKVQELAIEISNELTCNQTVVSIAALLHDIGKTYKAPPEILHKDHEKFNVTVSENFLKTLNLPDDDFKKICDIISYESDSIEMKIIKDADALALYFDKRLYMLLIQWLFANGLEHETSRKLNKFNNLNFEISKRIGKPKLEEMKKDWDEYVLSKK